MTKVDSSAIDAVGHDGNALIVEFKSGRQYRYPSAGPEHVEGMSGADSAGQYFNEHIRPHHPHEAT